MGAVGNRAAGVRSGTLSPLAWRDPSPTVDGPGRIAATFDNNLLSVRVPRTCADDLALRLLARTLHRTLVRFTGLVAGVELVLEPLGAHVLFAARAVAHERVFDPAAVQQAVDQALEASAALADAVLVEEIGRAQHPEAVARDLRPSTRALDALRTGDRPTSAQLVDELDRLTVPGVRRSLDRVHEAVLLGVPQTSAASPGPPLWAPPPILEPAEPSLRRRSRIPLQEPAGLARQQLRASTTSLQQTLSPVGARGWPAGPPQTSTVDLSNLIARLDGGANWTTLVDRENRRVTLAWPAYRRAAPLRARVDAATPTSIRRAVATDPAADAELHRQFRKRWVGLSVLILVALAVVVLFIWRPVSCEPGQQPVVVDVPAGQVVTLANGSTVQVSGSRWQKSSDQRSSYLVADVRQCGGDGTVDRDARPDERNWVVLEHFTLTRVTEPAEQVVPLSSGDVPLRAIELPAGQCTAGKIGFVLYAATQPSSSGVRYHNDAGDDVTWEVR